jgi:hypothetical protein
MEFKMSGSVNKVTLVGNLGRDPEISAMQNGDKVVKLSIATSDRWKDKVTGEQRERTEWHRVVIFNDALGRIAEKKVVLYILKVSFKHQSTPINNLAKKNTQLKLFFKGLKVN